MQPQAHAHQEATDPPTASRNGQCGTKRCAALLLAVLAIVGCGPEPAESDGMPDDVTAAITAQVLEAETMTVGGAYNGPVSDASASGGKALAFYSSGTGSATTTTGSVAQITV